MKKYIIFDKFLEVDSSAKKALLSSSTYLLQSLSEHLQCEFNTESKMLGDAGYWGRMANQNKFFVSVAYNLALAQKSDSILMCLEEDSYFNFLYVSHFLSTKEAYLEEVNKNLEKYSLSYDPLKAKIEFLPSFILQNLSKLKGEFKPLGLKVATLHGGYFSEMLTSYGDDSKYGDFEALFTQMGVTNLTTCPKYYAHLLRTNKKLALTCGVESIFELADLGADCLLSFSLSQFELLDTKRSKMSKYTKRDKSEIPVLFFSQLLLLSLGADVKNIGFKYHKNKIYTKHLGMPK